LKTVADTAKVTIND